MAENPNSPFDIYCISYNYSKYNEPENLGENINSDYWETSVFVDPDETYLIFESNRPGGYGQTDLYISFKDADNDWTKAINMGETVNSAACEGSPFVSADGLYLFFNSDRIQQFNRNPYWMSAEIIYSLKQNDAPAKPSQPTGPTSGKTGTVYDYTSGTTDPNENQIEYGWDWDSDMIVDEWTDLFDSGETVEMSHSWDIEGQYEIRVKAKDIFGVESEWSDPLVVSIPKNKLVNLFSWFHWFLNQHPRFFPFQRQILRL